LCPGLTDRSTSTMARIACVDFLLVGRIFCYSHPRSCLSHGTRSRVRVHRSRGCLVIAKRKSCNNTSCLYSCIRSINRTIILVHGLHDRALPYRYFTASSNGYTFLPTHSPSLPDLPGLNLSSASRDFLLTDSLSEPPLSVRLDFI
jgi:hypothetical protein